MTWSINTNEIYIPDRIEIVFRRFSRELHIMNYNVTAKPVLNVAWRGDCL
jgi:hypothetical protein